MLLNCAKALKGITLLLINWNDPRRVALKKEMLSRDPSINIDMRDSYLNNLDNESGLIEVAFYFDSGDKMTIVCEYIEIETA